MTQFVLLIHTVAVTQTPRSFCQKMKYSPTSSGMDYGPEHLTEDEREKKEEEEKRKKKRGKKEEKEKQRKKK